MPELPEIEAAMETLRRYAQGRTIARVQLLHPSLTKRVTPEQLRALAGGTIDRVERRGKHQLLHLRDGRMLHVHFRMNGDWEHGAVGAELPRHARAVFEFGDGTQLILTDSRALATFDIHPAGVELDLGLGPDAGDPKWTAEQLGAALAGKRGPIKPTLLDQRVVAGLGNIYSVEALWRAKISPFTRSDALSAAQVGALRKAIAAVIERATGSRYTDDDAASLDVYDREGLPCRRCRTPIERVVQAGRSTYFCPFCQPHGGVAVKKAGAKGVQKVGKKGVKKAVKGGKKIVKNAVRKAAKKAVRKSVKKAIRKKR
jgi:formamidopyrimidine-DNA glycosylase